MYNNRNTNEENAFPMSGFYNELTTTNVEHSFPLNMRRNYRSEIYLGYEEAVSLEMCEFIDKLMEYYTRYENPPGEFINELNSMWGITIQNLIGGIPVLFNQEQNYILRRIFNSHTFRAIIFSFINFFSISHRPSKINSLQMFFQLIQNYFLSENGFQELLKAQLSKNPYISRLKIIMKINICTKIAWEHYTAMPPARPKKFSQTQIFAIFQETMFSISLGIILKKSANTFVCNLPGCGDCVAVFKRIKKYFLFIECKKQKDRALEALIEFNTRGGINKSKPLAVRSFSNLTGLISKVDPEIRSRFLASFVKNYCPPPPPPPPPAPAPAPLIFSLGMLEIELFSKIKEIETSFNVWISAAELADLDAFVLAQSAFTDGKFTLRNTFGGLPQGMCAERDDFVELRSGRRTTRSDRKLTTSQLPKAYAGKKPIINITNPEEHAQSKLERRREILRRNLRNQHEELRERKFKTMTLDELKKELFVSHILDDQEKQHLFDLIGKIGQKMTWDELYDYLNNYQNSLGFTKEKTNKLFKILKDKQKEKMSWYGIERRLRDNDRFTNFNQAEKNSFFEKYANTANFEQPIIGRENSEHINVWLHPFQRTEYPYQYTRKIKKPPEGHILVLNPSRQKYIYIQKPPSNRYKLVFKPEYKSFIYQNKNNVKDIVIPDSINVEDIAIPVSMNVKPFSNNSSAATASAATASAATASAATAKNKNNNLANLFNSSISIKGKPSNKKSEFLRWFANISPGEQQEIMKNFRANKERMSSASGPASTNTKSTNTNSNKLNNLANKYKRLTISGPASTNT